MTLKVEWKFPDPDHTPILGHVVSTDADVVPDMEDAIKRCLKSFWCNSALWQARALPGLGKMMMLQATAFPMLSCRMPKWPITKVYTEKISSVQGNMIRIIMGFRYDEHNRNIVSRNLFKCVREVWELGRHAHIGYDKLVRSF